MGIYRHRRFVFLIVLFVCAGYSNPAFAQYNQYPANNANTFNPQQNNNSNSSFNNSSTGRQRTSLRGRNNTTGTDGQTDNTTRGLRSRRSSRTTGQTPGQPPNAAAIQPNVSLPGAPSGGAADALQIQGGASMGSSSGSRVIRNTPEIKIRKNATLYLSAPRTFAVLKEPFTVNVVLSNKTKAEYDRLSFLLQYNPKDLLLTVGQDASGEWGETASVAVSSSTETKRSGLTSKEDLFLADDASSFAITQNTVDSENGLIFMDMSSKKGPLTLDGKIVQLTFLPLRETRTSISFLYVNPILRDPSKEPLTRLSLKDQDQLGTRFSQADGVLDLELSIFQSLEQAERQPIVTKAGVETDEMEVGTIALSLVARNEEINVGDIVNVDVVLSNPDAKAFDTVYLLMAYNPRIFEPIDSDDRATGVNISDRDYGETFPLDFPILNVVDKDRGIIDYRKKAMGRPVRAEGTLATIQLKAIRPTKKSTFRLFINDTGKEPTTGLFYRYQDRLGQETDPFDGVSTCSVGVRATTAFLKKLNETN